MDPFDAAVQAGSIIGAARAVLRKWFEGQAQGDLIQMGTAAFGILARGTAG